METGSIRDEGCSQVLTISLALHHELRVSSREKNHKSKLFWFVVSFRIQPGWRRRLAALIGHFPFFFSLKNL